jgi:hypothetical protein
MRCVRTPHEHIKLIQYLVMNVSHQNEKEQLIQRIKDNIFNHKDNM